MKAIFKFHQNLQFIYFHKIPFQNNAQIDCMFALRHFSFEYEIPLAFSPLTPSYYDDFDDLIEVESMQNRSPD